MTTQPLTMFIDTPDLTISEEHTIKQLLKTSHVWAAHDSWTANKIMKHIANAVDCDLVQPCHPLRPVFRRRADG